MLLEIQWPKQTPNRLECYLKLTTGVQQPQGHDHPVLWRQALPEDRSSLSQKRWNPNHPLKKKQGEMSTAVTLTVHPLLDPCEKYCPAVFPSHNMKNLSNSSPYEIDLLGFKTFATVQSAGFVTRGPLGNSQFHATQRHRRPPMKKTKVSGKENHFITHTDTWNVNCPFYFCLKHNAPNKKTSSEITNFTPYS